MKKMSMTFESLCTRDFLPGDAQDPYGAHILPVYQTSTFVYESPEKIMDVFRGKGKAYVYSRWANPTVDAVERKIAALEAHGLKKDGKELPLKALLFSSGMAAISALFMSALKPGEKILTSGNIYGTTVELLNTLMHNHGIESVYIDLSDKSAVEDALEEDAMIRMIYCESPSNPTVKIYDLSMLSELAHRHGATLAVDNTFSSPYLQQPFRWGADYVVHSTTKYLNGHGTALGGILLSADAGFMEEKAWKMRKILGGNSNALEAWLLNNGLKTLPLRMEKHCSNAARLATFLESQRAVEKVHYAGLESNPDYFLAKKQMRLPGGVLSFELKGGLRAGIRFMKHIRFCTLTSTLGTPDTLITHPASMTHVSVPKAQRQANGIGDGLIRMSVGLENADDIKNDLERALAAI